MNAKKWLLMFLSAILLVLALYGAANVAIDPFGAFGDPYLQWYSFNMTNNPRIAKIAYLEKHHEEYDSYIIGSSSANGYPTELLDKYLDARFYNLFAYGCDMYDIGLTARYVIENYRPKNLLVNLGLNETAQYKVESADGMDRLHYKVDGSNALSFYKEFLFKNYKYSIAKLKDKSQKTWLPQIFNVFVPESGEYDKRARDVEHVGDLDTYLEQNPCFVPSVIGAPEKAFQYTQEALDTLAEIKRLCDTNGVNCIFVFPPIYRSQLNGYTSGQLANYMVALGNTVDFWDFSNTAASDEPRYFYDVTHFRNALGAMILARIFEDDQAYYPEGFGEFVTKHTVRDHVAGFCDPPSVDKDAYTIQVPILLYHNIREHADGDSDYWATTAEQFEADIKALYEKGYSAVSFGDLMDYVFKGAELPPKPVCITFDDGYLSNYTQAFPILKKYNFHATMFVIGATVGQMELYKNTQFPITPHFSWEQAREMTQSGLVDVESHTYDMHQHPEYDAPHPRTTALPLDGETEEEYIEALVRDHTIMSDTLMDRLGHASEIVSYPRGAQGTLSDALLRSMGVKVTLGIEPKMNTLVKGLPQCLYGMGRFDGAESFFEAR